MSEATNILEDHKFFGRQFCDSFDLTLDKCQTQFKILILISIK